MLALSPDRQASSLRKTFGVGSVEKWVAFDIPSRDVPASLAFESEFTITYPPTA